MFACLISLVPTDSPNFCQQVTIIPTLVHPSIQMSLKSWTSLDFIYLVLYPTHLFTGHNQWKNPIGHHLFLQFNIQNIKPIRYQPMIFINMGHIFCTFEPQHLWEIFFQHKFVKFLLKYCICHFIWEQLQNGKMFILLQIF